MKKEKNGMKGFGSREVSDSIVSLLYYPNRIIKANKMNPMIERLSRIPVFDGLSRKAKLSNKVFEQTTGLSPLYDRILLESLLRETEEMLGLSVNVEFYEHSVLISKH
jgi:hypothetical protein